MGTEKYGEGLEYGSWSQAQHIICKTWWRLCDGIGMHGVLVFIDDMTEDGSNRINSDVYRNILSAHIQPNSAKLIGRRFTVQMANDPKHSAKATQVFFKAKKWNILQWSCQSPDLNPIEHAFHLLKMRLNSERPANKQQLKTATVKAWQSIAKVETQHLVMSMGSRLQTVITCKLFSTKY